MCDEICTVYVSKLNIEINITKHINVLYKYRERYTSQRIAWLLISMSIIRDTRDPLYNICSFFS